MQFKVCWSNYSTSSAFDFTITDAVPAGTVYVPEPANTALCGATNAMTYATDYALAYSTSANPTPADYTTIGSPGGASPPGGTRWLRWTVGEIGVNTTGCFCYRLTVN